MSVDDKLVTIKPGLIPDMFKLLYKHNKWQRKIIQAAGICNWIRLVFLKKHGHIKVAGIMIVTWKSES